MAAVLVAIASPPVLPGGGLVPSIRAEHQGRGSGARARQPDKDKPVKGNRTDGIGLGIRIDRERERRIVVVYVGRGSLPPGLAKREGLPPGLARQLRERGQLPPGLEKHLHRLPHALEIELPPLPAGHIRRIAGDDLLIIDVSANLLVAHIRAVFVR